MAVSVTSNAAEVDHTGMHHAGMHDNGAMNGLFGDYPMTREASGTSWQPDAAPHEGIAGSIGEWTTMTHGFANLIYDHQDGPRGDHKTFSTSMLMVTARRAVADGTLGLRGMVSLDPLMGRRGYPLLLQTGESADGTTPLIDRQHPHDFFMELAGSYSHRLSSQTSVFVYAGLPGEPALGPPAFMHRLSGMDNPEAPISHHWLDSTHITYGVVTLGYVFDRFKLEASAFRGREPDQNRWDIETGRLDSAAVRLSWNPTPAWALQLSRGHIESPEQLEPTVNVNRSTASAVYNHVFGDNHWQTTLAWGRNAPSESAATDAYLLESAIALAGLDTWFGRLERATKHDLFPPGAASAEDRFTVYKLSLGYVHDIKLSAASKFGVGGLVSRYALPGELRAEYGSGLTSYMLFARLKLQ
jgi:hypothetical protein